MFTVSVAIPKIRCWSALLAGPILGLGDRSRLKLWLLPSPDRLYWNQLLLQNWAISNKWFQS